MHRRNLIVLAVLSASLAAMLSTGIRQSFGLFLQPISAALGTGREEFSLAIALSNIIYGLPLVGLLSDRFGPRWIVVGGGLLYTAGLLTVTQITSAGGLYLSLGVLIGLGLSATTYVVVLGAVAQLVPPSQHSRIFGLITATGSAGMFVVPPLAQLLISTYGWVGALTLLAAVALVIAVLAFGLPARPSQNLGANAEPVVEDSFLELLQKARGHRGYLLLVAGFFVCGFHVAFIATHLPAYLSDRGIASFVSAGALSLIGAFNVVGSAIFGWLGDRWRRKYLLSAIYLGRALIISLFLLLPLTQMFALVFSAAIGLLWLATVPLTSGTVSQIFGSRYLSSLYGIVFFSHQIGAFLGVWLGGRIYDVTGSYTPVWIAAIVLGVLASLIHLPITDNPVGRAALSQRPAQG